MQIEEETLDRADLLEKDRLKILIVDDHQLILGGTLQVLQQNYPDAVILTAQTTREALEIVENDRPALVVVDLSLPENLGKIAQIHVGISFLQTLMELYPTINLTIQSSNVKALARIKHKIDKHKGGFTIADKGLSTQEMLNRLDWALQGITYTKDLASNVEVKPEWLELLRLAFAEGWTDKAIAEIMCKSERTIRHYWTKIQDALGVYPEKDKNIRSLTLIRAREKGLID